jgi:hypothetical protein
MDATMTMSSAENRTRNLGERKHRSRVSNDLLHLPGFHGNSAIGRRYRTLVRGTLEAMGFGATDEIGEMTREQIRTAALLQIQLDGLQARALAGETGLDAETSKLANTISRLRWQLGIARRKRSTLTPEDLGQYIAKGGSR